MEPLGFWVGGAASAQFVVAPDEGSPIRLFVRNTAVENRVILESGSWRQELLLHPGEERIVDVLGVRQEVGTLLRVTSSSGARPVDFDPNSTDERALGCWIETR